MRYSEIYQKAIREGGVYDTQKYRYRIDTSTGELKRALLDDLDTTAMYLPGAWKTVYVPDK